MGAKYSKDGSVDLHLLGTVVNNANDAILVTEAWPVSKPGPRIVYINESFSRMIGYTEEDVIGKTPRILQGPVRTVPGWMRSGRRLISGSRSG